MARRPADGRAVRARAHARRQRTAAVLVALGAVLGATSPAAPAGSEVTDRLLAALFAATLTYAGRRSHRWPLLVPAAVGLVFGDAVVGVLLGAGALGTTIAAGWHRRRDSRLGMLAAALGAGALLRLADVGFHGATALLAVAAAAPVLVSGWREARPRERRAAVRIGIGLAVLAVLAAAGSTLALLLARDDVTRGQAALDRGVAAARDGDDATAAAELRVAAEAFEDAAGLVGSWWGTPGASVPVLGHNVRAVQVAAEVAAEVGDAGADIMERAGGDALEVRAGRVPVDAIADLARPAAHTLAAVADGERRAAAAASPWLLPFVDDRFDELLSELADTRPDVELAVDAVDAIPGLLGADGPRRYLVLFVTPVEARATGFPGNYAELVVTDGVLDMTRFGRITDLEQATPPEARTLDLGREYHARYERFRPATFLRNLTSTPHFPTVAEAVRQLYPQVGGAPLDGVLAVDPAAIAAVLRLTGPVEVPELDEPLSADNAEEFLLRDQYVEFGDTPDRVDALETLGSTAFERLTTGDLPGPTDIADVLAPVADAGHLRIVAFDDVGAAFLDRVEVSGALAPVDGADALTVTNNNSVGGKIDLFLERDIAYDVRWDPETGSVAATATITMRNTTPTDAGLPDYVLLNTLEGPGADLPVGTNRTYLSIFTPWALEGATLDGRPLAMEAHTEQGRSVYSAIVDIAPDGGAATVTVELAGVLAGPEYRFSTRPQLLAVPDRFTMTLEATERLAAGDGFTVDGTRATTERDLRAPATLAVTTNGA